MRTHGEKLVCGTWVLFRHDVLDLSKSLYLVYLYLLSWTFCTTLGVCGWEQGG